VRHGGAYLVFFCLLNVNSCWQIETVKVAEGTQECQDDENATMVVNTASESQRMHASHHSSTYSGIDAPWFDLRRHTYGRVYHASLGACAFDGLSVRSTVVEAKVKCY
jgi:hypothetical protein